MPATNILSERSYGALRRIKNYVRSTMTQKWMNNLMLMSQYGKEDADNLNLIDIEFAKDVNTPEALTGCQNLNTFHLNI